MIHDSLPRLDSVTQAVTLNEKAKYHPTENDVINQFTRHTASASDRLLSSVCDSDVVRDGGVKGSKKRNVKKSQKLLQVNPNLFTHINIADPAKGCKLNYIYEELEDRMKTFTLPPPWDGPVNYQSMAEGGFM